jgi:glycosyltransferase involved in cell wall biosynthesis
VLLTVSGTVDPNIRAEIRDGRRPEADYVALARAFDADIVDYAAAARESGPAGRAIGRLAGRNAQLAWVCRRRARSYRAVFTDGEQVGLPYAAMSWLGRRRPRHVMIGHLLSPRKKVYLHRALQLRRRIDQVVVYSSRQRRVAIEELGYRPEDVLLTPFMVDTSFWDPHRVRPRPRPRPMICAVGQELRDYPTLVAAIEGLDIDVVLAAASPWSKREDTSAGLEIPPNVEVRAFDQYDLRQLYADCAFVVVPLQETDFQAGITTILEAMAMERAVVCSRTSGQTDTIVEGETGRYVPPGDPVALRQAIERLLADPDEAHRLGAAGRRWAVEHADIGRYADRLAATTAAPGPTARG